MGFSIRDMKIWFVYLGYIKFWNVYTEMMLMLNAEKGCHKMELRGYFTQRQIRKFWSSDAVDLVRYVQVRA